MFNESDFVNLKAKELGEKFITDMKTEQPDIFNVLVKYFDCFPVKVNAEYSGHLSYSLSFPDTVKKEFTKEQFMTIRSKLYKMITKEIVLDMIKNDTNYFTMDFYDYLSKNKLIDY